MKVQPAQKRVQRNMAKPRASRRGRSQKENSLSGQQVITQSSIERFSGTERSRLSDMNVRESDSFENSELTSASIIELRQKYFKPEIEQQLQDFKKDIESKFASSKMNATY